MKLFEFTIAIDIEAETKEDAILELGEILYMAHDLESILNPNKWEVEELVLYNEDDENAHLFKEIDGGQPDELEP